MEGHNHCETAGQGSRTQEEDSHDGLESRDDLVRSRTVASHRRLRSLASRAQAPSSPGIGLLNPMPHISTVASGHLDRGCGPPAKFVSASDELTGSGFHRGSGRHTASDVNSSRLPGRCWRAAHQPSVRRGASSGSENRYLRGRPIGAADLRESRVLNARSTRDVDAGSCD